MGGEQGSARNIAAFKGNGSQMALYCISLLG